MLCIEVDLQIAGNPHPTHLITSTLEFEQYDGLETAPTVFTTRSFVQRDETREAAQSAIPRA